MNREEGMRSMEYNKMMRCYSQKDRVIEQKQNIYEAIYARHMRIRQALYFGRNSNDGAHIAKYPYTDKLVCSFMEGVKSVARKYIWKG